MRIRFEAISLALLCCLVYDARCFAQPAQDPGAADAVTMGQICVEASSPKKVVSVLKNAGGAAKQIDGNCGDLISLAVPHGLESWSITILKKAGYQKADHPIASAGGSGVIKRRLDAGELYQGSNTPSTLEGVHDLMRKRIRERLAPYFSDILIKPCPRQVIDSELCWNVWLGGHVSTSTGLPRKCLGGLVSERYWFSVRLEMWMGEFGSYPDNDGNRLGKKVRFDAAVISSKYARMPASDKPEAGNYRPISSYEPSVDEYELDVLIAERIADLVLNSKYATCS